MHLTVYLIECVGHTIIIDMLASLFFWKINKLESKTSRHRPSLPNRVFGNKPLEKYSSSVTLLCLGFPLTVQTKFLCAMITFACNAQGRVMNTSQARNEIRIYLNKKSISSSSGNNTNTRIYIYIYIRRISCASGFPYLSFLMPDNCRIQMVFPCCMCTLLESLLTMLNFFLFLGRKNTSSRKGDRGNMHYT